MLCVCVVDVMDVVFFVCIVMRKCLCRDVVDSNLHCHIITKADVKKSYSEAKIE